MAIASPMQGMLSTQMSSISHSHSHSHSHSRKHSGELDVFEATRYFSGVADAHKTFAWRAMRGDRRSLDMPLDAKVPQPHQKVELISNNMVKDKVKCKQPRSPGGKLASFLNNFFQQYSNSKKSKKSSSSSKLVKSDQEEGNSRRKRSSSRGSSTIHHESKSCCYSSSCSSSGGGGFRTPSLNNYSKKRMSEGFKDNNEDSIWGDEFRLKTRLGDELKIKKEEKFEFRDQDQVDDDYAGESDSSSDLFELKINLYEFGEINSSGLPVYGSTDVGVIRNRERFASTVTY